MWPDTFEDWYGPLGIDRDALLHDYEGEWSVGFARALVRAGHEVHIFYGSRTGAASGRQRRSGALLHFIPVPAPYRALLHAAWARPSSPPGAWLQAVWPAAPAVAALSPRLVASVRSVRPDAVVVQDYESLRFDILAPLLRLAGLRVVGLDTGGSASPSTRPWKHLTRRTAAKLLAGHEREAARLRAAGLRPVAVWTPPVRTDLYGSAPARQEARASLGVGIQEQIVFCAGRLHPVKQLPVLAAACAHAGAHLVVAGEGPDRPALERMAASGTPVRLLGPLAPEEVALWYAACDLSALASTQEGQPLAVIEALAAGRAVVATEVGGVPEVVLDGVTGWLVPPRDQEALAAALKDALADPEEADARGRRGRELVSGRFSPEAFAASMVQLLAGY